MRLSDTIEQFIKTMLAQEETQIELRRNELAEYFGCAPSQINYVLSTRFTPDHGYIIESRRGGGGCIRIVRIQQSTSEHLLYLIHQRIGESITETECNHLITQLMERGLVTSTEAQLMRSAVSSQALGIPIPQQLKDALRARTLRNMLLVIARKQPETTPSHP